MAKTLESSGLPVKNDDQHEKRALKFIAVCVLLAATMFGLIHAVIHLTDPPREAADSTANSGTARRADKAMLVLP
jgi:hypothetical protein